MLYIYILYIYILYIYIYIHINRFGNIYQTLIQIRHNREMTDKIFPNMKLTPPCTPLPQYN